MTGLVDTNLATQAATGSPDQGGASAGGIPKYREYKNSDVVWIGEVPSFWEVKPFKWLLTHNEGGVWGDDPAGEGDTIVLRSTDQTVDGNWNVTDPAVRHLTVKENASAVLEAGDLVVTKSSGSALHIGKTTLVNVDMAKLGYCYGNFMQRLRLGQKYIPKLAWYVMNNDLVRLQLNLLSNSTTGLANLNATLIGEILLPVPPVEEQTQIARFLDHETARIDALIEEQQRLIELLKEKRQAIISHAVTKGLDPTVPMKDSGVEWLGEVPAHWITKPLKHLAELNPKKSGYHGDRDELCSFVPMEKLKTGVIQLDEERFIADVISGYTYFEDGDVLQAKVTPCFENRNIAIADGLTNGVGFGSSEINVLRPFPDVNASFLYYRLQEDGYMGICTASMIGAGGLKRVPGEVINGFTVAVPERHEQTQIAHFLDHETARVDKLVEEANVGIELLKERRSALISAAVTGKIDVRGWQPPASAPSPELENEAV
ncbi:Restriction endonuclease S subunits-like protein [Nitrosococcus oceani ATCC 19707]|uniref:Restriction endonuclease S subunits-like protein n=2 Tax=Nitrosococcus oceani TaxID=1229 RepID=Q3J7Q5_NITOC|nr:restriction endonuclease subunit S [Nitrosococcus oceani]ABA59141.1 Restriction endonuclease S subunits-like protein [Nitrosococcus oceani ATCC 19707]EDZ66196.1 hypothetical protein NOC27_2876 [Nitrosococcus oceani AFC27]KFI18464.1 restriction endonuclease subunit S [Nitrosococcus oceani C-27]GEM20329.1 restriction endonuclease S [Nitrosococcus oceani]